MHSLRRAAIVALALIGSTVVVPVAHAAKPKALGVTYWHGIKMTQMSAPPVVDVARKGPIARAASIGLSGQCADSANWPNWYGCNAYFLGGPIVGPSACCDRATWQLDDASNYLHTGNAQKWIGYSWAPWALSTFGPSVSVVYGQGVNWWDRVYNTVTRTMSYFAEPNTHSYIWVAATAIGTDDGGIGVYYGGDVQWGIAYGVAWG